MRDRFALIARKQEVRRQIEQVRRQLEREQAQASPSSAGLGSWKRNLSS